MPLRLWRYMLIELLKVMVVTTLVLVTVVSFGAAIKPLTENLLGPQNIARYILFATLPMLQYVLPFAGGFAATIVMHRFATDNELLAMASSGMSHARIFTPIFALAAIMTIVMLALVHVVVPTFAARLESMLARDVAHVLASSVNQGEAISFGSMQLYADEAIVRPEAPETGADERIVLTGVAALEVEDDGSPVAEFTAATAVVDVYRRPRDTLLKLSLADATMSRHEDGALAFVPSARPDAVALPKLLRGGAKGMRTSEFDDAAADPERFPVVVDARRPLERELESIALWRCTGDAFASGRPVEFTGEAGRVRFTIEGARLEGTTLRGTPEITMTQSVDGVPRRRAIVESATLEASDRLGEEAPRLTLAATATAVDLSDPVRPTVRWPRFVSRLTVVQCPDTDLEGIPVLDLVAQGKELLAADAFRYGPVDSLRANLRNRIARVDADVHSRLLSIDGERVERTAQAVAAPLMLMLGAVLAVLLRQQFPLTIYVVSFVPAIAAILLISTGDQVVRDGHHAVGFVIAWAGNAGMLLALVVSWFLVRRH